MRYNGLADNIAQIVRECGCNNVRTEPLLLPVNANDFISHTNTADGARLDISARGINSIFERSFYDVRVSHPHCTSNVTLSLSELYEKNEKEKDLKYKERIHEGERGSFTSFFH
jgi:hypothetical protein